MRSASVHFDVSPGTLLTHAPGGFGSGTLLRSLTSSSLSSTLLIEPIAFAASNCAGGTPNIQRRSRCRSVSSVHAPEYGVRSFDSVCSGRKPTGGSPVWNWALRLAALDGLGEKAPSVLAAATAPVAWSRVR